MSSTLSGQGGVGGAIAYYMYLNGHFEGMVDPVDAGGFEGNWADQGLSTPVVASGPASTAPQGGNPSSSNPPVGPGTNPAYGGKSPGGGATIQPSPTPSVDSHAAQLESGKPPAVVLGGQSPGGKTPAVTLGNGQVATGGGKQAPVGNPAGLTTPAPQPGVGTGFRVDIKL